MRIGLGIQFGESGHEVTCWGIEYDLQNPDQIGKFKGIWITDSDDDKHTENPSDQLKYYAVDYNADQERWYLKDYFGGDFYYIDTVMALARKPGATVSDPITI